MQPNKIKAFEVRINPKWKCRYCKEKFKYAENYYSHIKTLHELDYKLDRAEGKDIRPINLLEPIKQGIDLR